MKTDETEVVRVGTLAVGDLVLTGGGWREVAAVEPARDPQGSGADVLRVEFAGDAPRRYLAGSTFARRVEL